MRDEEDGQADIYNMIQKRPNSGCRNKDSSTLKQNKEYHEESTYKLGRARTV